MCCNPIALSVCHCDEALPNWLLSQTLITFESKTVRPIVHKRDSGASNPFKIREKHLKFLKIALSAFRCGIARFQLNFAPVVFISSYSFFLVFVYMFRCFPFCSIWRMKSFFWFSFLDVNFIFISFSFTFLVRNSWWKMFCFPHRQGWYCDSLKNLSFVLSVTYFELLCRSNAGLFLTFGSVGLTIKVCQMYD